MNLREYLTKNNRVFVPLFSIIYSVAVFALSLVNAYMIVLIFTIPVVMFVFMHYLKMYHFKPRLFGGLVIILIVLLIVAGMYSTYFYDENGISKETVKNTSLETMIEPFSGVDKNYSITIITNYTGNLTSSSLVISEDGAHNRTIPYSDLNATPPVNGTITMHYSTHLPSGLYDINYSINKSIYIDSPGPVNVGRSAFYGYYIYALGAEYIAALGILYVIGIIVAYFLGRSNTLKVPPNRK